MVSFSLRQILVRSDTVASAASEYGELIGAPVTFADGERYIALEKTPVTVAVVAASESEYPVTLAFKVADVDAAVEHLVGLGHRLTDGPRDSAHERQARLLDRAGVPVSVYAPKKS